VGIEKHGIFTSNQCGPYFKGKVKTKKNKKIWKFEVLKKKTTLLHENQRDSKFSK
jgi:hypothetical protein